MEQFKPDSLNQKGQQFNQCGSSKKKKGGEITSFDYTGRWQCNIFHFLEDILLN